ncbi:MAG: methyltransferase family protein [Anaerovibrio sp.]
MAAKITAVASHLRREASDTSLWATTSPLINAHEYVGAFLASTGFAAFLIGAVQIYYSKFTRKGAVTGGIYRIIRHPQYTAFAICGLGLLLLWPRFINLFMFVTMLFVYYLLAKAEERECESKFGASYLEYKTKTAMFLPLKNVKFPHILPQNKAKKAIVLTALYLGSLTASYLFGSFLYSHSLESLYASYQENSATIAVCPMEHAEIDDAMSIIAGDRRTAGYINAADGKYLNYILPVSWYAAEVPMNSFQQHSGHASPRNYDHTQYKVIITRATLRTPDAVGMDILTQAMAREPLAEIWIDLKNRSVTKIMSIPESYKYCNIPVALY